MKTRSFDKNSPSMASITLQISQKVRVPVVRRWAEKRCKKKRKITQCRLFETKSVSLCRGTSTVESIYFRFTGCSSLPSHAWCLSIAIHLDDFASSGGRQSFPLSLPAKLPRMTRGGGGGGNNMLRSPFKALISPISRLTIESRYESWNLSKHLSPQLPRLNLFALAIGSRTITSDQTVYNDSSLSFRIILVSTIQIIKKWY